MMTCGCLDGWSGWRVGDSRRGSFQGNETCPLWLFQKHKAMRIIQIRELRESWTRMRKRKSLRREGPDGSHGGPQCMHRYRRSKAAESLEGMSKR
jgi:hypothetical protein